MIADDFARWTGRTPAFLSVAPGRVNLIGEHTDYSGGFVLPVALDRYTTVAAGPRDDDVLRARSVQFSDDDRWTAYVDGVAKALREAGVPVGGADLLVDSEVPVGAGLSSSAALEVAAAAALAAVAGSHLQERELAAVAHRAETEFVGMPSGVMDQSIVALARPGHALFLDTRSLASELVPFDPAVHGLALVLVDSGVRRELTDGRYAERRQEVERAAAALGVTELRDATVADVERGELDGTLRRRARHVVTENGRVLEVVQLLRRGDVAAVGPFLLAGHASLRDDFEVSCAELDEAVDAAMDNGAVGARMTGGGFGGYALALVPDARLGGLLSAFHGRATVAQPAGGVRTTPAMG